MSTIELKVAPQEDDIDLAVSECEDIEEFEEEVALLLSDAERGGSLRIGLHLAGSHPFTTPQAMRVLVQALERFDEKRVTAVCLVPSQRAADQLARELPTEPRKAWTRDFGSLQVVVQIGDITTAQADAIVNASNTRLVLGGGVSGAIARVAGTGLQTEMAAAAPIKPGEVVVTGAHASPSTRLILHAATASGGPAVIGRAMKGIFEQIETLNLSSVAIPALGTGTGGLSMVRCAEVIRGELQAHLRISTKSLRIIFVVRRDTDHDTFVRVFSAAAGATNEEPPDSVNATGD